MSTLSALSKNTTTESTPERSSDAATPIVTTGLAPLRSTVPGSVKLFNVGGVVSAISYLPALRRH